ncbi:DUF934 domain-containing protein [Candidatus Methylomicrobium oryzae]|jgi:uncharacterized protein (DUF934 family)|uniref:DUF934 domain-containing protein n=1 Tax=Candidatus Methylomicrobium oryzae TaxID=2802053 RepID=UPI0019212BF9|nr:DUF934 domain-containing protein [Methylomicrobium sp. RS1]MBL1264330.1 DUF934 domain-containing protein [Methylomicrobium sp. RS1]
MQIIKDKAIIDDTFTPLADDAPLASGDISVSLARWKNDRETLLAHADKVGVRLQAGDSVSDLADDLKRIDLIELNFAEFADGRLFSQAWLLRGRYHYQGEIRAAGHYLTDQTFYLSRVGVNAFQPAKPDHLNTILANLSDFSVKYQPSIQ